MKLAPFRTIRIVFLILVACRLAAQVTEVPETVAPGRFLFEIDAISLRFDRDGSEKATGLLLGSTYVTTGLTANWDIQLGADLFLSQKITSSGFTERNSGVGDITVRSKWKFFDDKTTGLSIALLAFVKLPTNSGHVGNHAIEGGVLVPLRLAMPAGLDFTAMSGIDLRRNELEGGYDPGWHTSAALGFSLTSLLSLYAEATLYKCDIGTPWEGTLGAGIVFQLHDNFSWDLAVYRGLTNGASDWNPVLRCNIGF